MKKELVLKELNDELLDGCNRRSVDKQGISGGAGEWYRCRRMLDVCEKIV